MSPRAAASGLIPADLEATIVLVRHGESTWIAEHRFQGRGDPPLSKRGRQQAGLVGARLAAPLAPPALPLPAGPPLGIWTSPLRRAAETAQAIAGATAERRGAAPPLYPQDGFTEIAQGVWEGLLASEVEAGWGRRLAGWRRDPTHVHAPQGESLRDADLRVSDGLRSVLTALGAGSAGPAPTGPRTFVPGYGAAAATHPWAVVVAHDGVFRLALLRLLRVPRSHFWSVPFVLAGISVVELRDGLAVLRAHGLDTHLAALDDGAEEDRARSGAL
ncbi:MAG: histidine phosphatase family protein [Candidatus Limnocylindrales bacterium]